MANKACGVMLFNQMFDGVIIYVPKLIWECAIHSHHTAGLTGISTTIT